MARRRQQPDRINIIISVSVTHGLNLIYIGNFQLWKTWYPALLRTRPAWIFCDVCVCVLQCENPTGQHAVYPKILLRASTRAHTRARGITRICTFCFREQAGAYAATYSRCMRDIRLWSILHCSLSVWYQTESKRAIARGSIYNICTLA